MASSKERALQMISSLPASVDMQEIMYQLYVLDSIREAEAEIDAGDVVSHDDVLRESSEW